MTIQNSTRPTEVERMHDVMDIAACIYSTWTENNNNKTNKTEHEK